MEGLTKKVQVCIQGLTKRVDLNGTIGTIMRVENGWYVLEIRGHNEVHLKPQHLVVSAPPLPLAQRKKRKRIVAEVLIHAGVRYIYVHTPYIYSDFYPSLSLSLSLSLSACI